jgi:hypothetical protein
MVSSRNSGRHRRLVEADGMWNEVFRLRVWLREALAMSRPIATPARS